MGKKHTKPVYFTEESYTVMERFRTVLGFGTMSALVQAAVVEYLSDKKPLLDTMHGLEVEKDG